MNHSLSLYEQWEREASQSMKALAFFARRSGRLSVASLKLGLFLSSQLVALLFKPPRLIRYESQDRPGREMEGATLNQSWARPEGVYLERFYLEQRK